MVYFNISEEVKSENQNKIPYAKAFSRFFSAMLDYFIFAPVVSFFMVMFFRESVQVMSRTSGSQSNLIIVQLAIFAILLFTGLQTVFIYFHRATPGQSFLKLYTAFEQKPSNLFFQIWFRQIGFVLSLALLGLPFLAIIYHHKHRAFYDRFSECDVLSSVPMEPHLSLDEARPVSAFRVYETDKKYLSASVSAVMCFAAFIFVFSILQAHGVLLNKIQVATLNKPEVKKCFVIENQNQAERLKTALALNILNLTSDDCALSEADSVFNQMKIGQADKQDPQDVSLAYFVKYYIGQKTAESQINKEEYFKYACGHGVKTDLCAAVEDRNVASETTQAISPQKLKNKLLEYIGKVQK
jgi:RDD family